MSTIIERLKAKDWTTVTENLTSCGYAVVSGVLTPDECGSFIEAYKEDENYRKTISMERYRFGIGEYKYFEYPLPDLITDIRETVYAYIAPVANQWMEDLNMDTRFPPTHEELKILCNKHEQTKPTILILKYGTGGFNTLHQDLYGDIYFPMQLVLFLNEVDEDYTGGEFVLTESIPRAQSKANVIKPKRGDMLLFTTKFRPIKGKKGYYRVSMKHGVSPLHSGNRHTLGIIFHDALN
ncbi:2OG-Fe(II) oxygenase [Mucilaginibacter sp. cycad4]|uniref:2OG-Fe(II) oxygenase n=1 Tax=Mucilaginibacter sp. cycad4 TaxID=3342096 RepID=UPI002AAB9742|nr:2OG-Fe(II) oxygenase [Mucilaginibacter gossypii]WPV02112.1 2OG-Fe(II) oxygenase [Mucilaginibacter gossypii]